MVVRRMRAVRVNRFSVRGIEELAQARGVARGAQEGVGAFEMDIYRLPRDAKAFGDGGHGEAVGVMLVEAVIEGEDVIEARGESLLEVSQQFRAGVSELGGCVGRGRDEFAQGGWVIAVGGFIQRESEGGHTERVVDVGFAEAGGAREFGGSRLAPTLALPHLAGEG